MIETVVPEIDLFMSNISNEIVDLLKDVVKRQSTSSSAHTFSAQAFESILAKLHHLTALEDEVATTRPLLSSLQKRVEDYNQRETERAVENVNMNHLIRQKTDIFDEQVHSIDELRNRCATVR